MLSGLGANLRTALNSQNIKMYDDRTSRFDSPFQTGNCGGDGTCGTCVVAVLSGKSYFPLRRSSNLEELCEKSNKKEEF